MAKASRININDTFETPERKPKSEIFFFLLAVLSPLVGIATYTFW
jgi:hypothetical protein